MWENWANKLLPKALKSYLKSNKSPNWVTLATTTKNQSSVWRGWAWGFNTSPMSYAPIFPSHSEWRPHRSSVTRLGDFFKVLCSTFSYLSGQNISWLLRPFENISFWSKNYCVYFLGNFWKIRPLFIQTSGHTDSNSVFCSRAIVLSSF